MSVLDEYFDLISAAAFLGIHPQSLRRIVKAGDVPHQFFAGKYLFEPAALQQFKSGYSPRPGRKRMGRLI